MAESPTLLVVSAHAADFVWRCGGAMARYARAGSRVHVVCVSQGARGESTSLWVNDPEMTEAEAIRIRKAESRAAAEILGATAAFLDLGDHPMSYGQEEIMRLAEILRQHQPRIVLTHHARDYMNPDHVCVHDLTRWAVRAATVAGVLPGQPRLRVPRVYSFEPDQAALDGFQPDVYVDISDVFDVKRRAMESVATQAAEMAERYTDRARYRAALARGTAQRPIAYAEGFVSHLPHVGERFPE